MNDYLPIPAPRQSNFELLRIILMLSVIAHHYVVNSGVMELFDYFNISKEMVYLQFFGAFGKIAINTFLLITGYFMCRSTTNLKKCLRLYLEIKFYRILFYFVFVVSGYTPFNYHELLETFFSTIFRFGIDYSETYLVLYLLIPFLNILINKMTAREHAQLLGILIFVFTFISSFSIFLSVKHSSNDTWNYLFWMITMYLIGAYIRKHPVRFFNNSAYVGTAFVINAVLIFASILVVDFIGVRFDFIAQYWFVNDTNKLFALSASVFLFCWFKNLKINYNPVINAVASTTFGIFLIHTIHDPMRTFLWTDFFSVKLAYASPNLVVHSLFAVFVIFVVCALIDMLRIHVFEKPLFSILNNQKFNVN